MAAVTWRYDPTSLVDSLFHFGLSLHLFGLVLIAFCARSCLKNLRRSPSPFWWGCMASTAFVMIATLMELAFIMAIQSDLTIWGWNILVLLAGDVTVRFGYSALCIVRLYRAKLVMLQPPRYLFRSIIYVLLGLMAFSLCCVITLRYYENLEERRGGNGVLGRKPVYVDRYNLSAARARVGRASRASRDNLYYFKDPTNSTMLAIRDIERVFTFITFLAVGIIKLAVDTLFATVVANTIRKTRRNSAGDATFLGLETWRFRSLAYLPVMISNLGYGGSLVGFMAPTSAGGLTFVTITLCRFSATVALSTFPLYTVPKTKALIAASRNPSSASHRPSNAHSSPSSSAAVSYLLITPQFCDELNFYLDDASLLDASFMFAITSSITEVDIKSGICTGEGLDPSFRRGAVNATVALFVQFLRHDLTGEDIALTLASNEGKAADALLALAAGGHDDDQDAATNLSLFDELDALELDETEIVTQPLAQVYAVAVSKVVQSEAIGHLVR
ncbi:hypothetical protein H9P43_002611 [Blastocladiella emersonii ATCC 22665]|nr:hypothetical protein H9P43_002611 [Blastocladiella emersonii ATCC 22665]